MATFNALTNEQKQIIRAHMQLLRVLAGREARIMNSMAGLLGIWNSTVAPVVALLDAGAQIGDNSELAGAIAVTKEACQDEMTSMAALLTTYNTSARRAALISLTGIPNALGD